MSAFTDGLDALIAELRFREEVVLPATALAIMEESVAHGETEMRRILDAPESYTATGEDRVATGQGDSAGRHLDGTMIEGIASSVEDLGDVIVGKFGWADPDDYFLYQDWGTDGHVPAAHSLQKAFIQTTAIFEALVDGAAA